MSFTGFVKFSYIRRVIEILFYYVNFFRYLYFIECIAGKETQQIEPVKKLKLF